MNEEVIVKPLLPLRGMVVFPGMLTNVDVGRDYSMKALRVAYETDKEIVLITQKETEKNEFNGSEDLYTHGVLAKVKECLRLPNGALRTLVEGHTRVVLQEISFNEEQYYEAQVCVAQETDHNSEKAQVLRNLVMESFERSAVTSKKAGPDVMQGLQSQKDNSRFTDMLLNYINLSVPERQELLEQLNVAERMEAVYALLEKEQRLGELSREISEKVHRAIEQSQKEYFLREQIKTISKELGEGEDLLSEVNSYRERLNQMQVPQQAKEKIERELSRLAKMPAMTPESAVLRTYIDTVMGLPWNTYTEESFDIKAAEEVLEAEHYGLKKVKERILEYLAVRQLSAQPKGPILCLVGPPGVGKTSLARSIATAMNRKFTRISLGGVRDESEIRGHRRTYLGSMPGRIIRGISDCSCLNPVFLLDEVDKLCSDFRGDPAAALLEALDPEQNNTFSDNFIEIPFDLSKVFWIVTANTTETIPAALLDRMEVISLSSYTELEKLQIAKRHLLPKQRKENGLEEYKISVSDKALARIIRDYTREAGVRTLERKLAGVFRKLAYKIVRGEAKGAQVTNKNLEKYLGPVIFVEDPIDIAAAVGSCNGLAWTSVGGELLKVEVLTYKGKGNLQLTGQLGDVMKESAQAGFTYIRSRAKELGIDTSVFEEKDLHIHLPEGAVPKDGPSAGITMVTAMVSALTGRKVRAKLAMTGEIALSGRVLAVGGIKEKMLAAYRNGIETVLLPQRNVQDIDELPEEVRTAMTFIPVAHLDEVLAKALEE